MLIEYLWFFIAGLVTGMIIEFLSFRIKCKNKGNIIVSKNENGPCLKFKIFNADEIPNLKEVRFEVLALPDTLEIQAGNQNEK